MGESQILLPVLKYDEASFPGHKTTDRISPVNYLKIVCFGIQQVFLRIKKPPGFRLENDGGTTPNNIGRRKKITNLFIRFY